MQPITNILVSVLGANLSVIVICLIGAHLYQTNTINSDFLVQLSKVIEKVFLPSLILTSFLKSITVGELWHIFPIAISAFLVCAVGYVVGVISSYYWIKDKQNESIVILACSNPHTVSIQLQITYCLQFLIESMQIERKYNNPIDTITRAVTSIMIFSTVANTLRWTLGKQLMARMVEEVEQSHLLELPMIETHNHQADDITNISFIQGHTHQDQNQNSYSIVDQLRKVMMQITQMSMPLLAICLAITLMIFYPLQQVLLNRDSFFHQFLFSPLQTIGRASTPCVLIMLGANMCSIVQRITQGESNSISKTTLLKITFTRLIIVPIVGIFMLYILVKYGILVDPVSIFVTFLTYISPSAVNILVQAKQYNGNEDVVSTVLAYSYIGAIFTLPLWIIFFFTILY